MNTQLQVPQVGSFLIHFSDSQVNDLLFHSIYKTKGQHDKNVLLSPPFLGIFYYSNLVEIIGTFYIIYTLLFKILELGI